MTKERGSSLEVLVLAVVSLSTFAARLYMLPSYPVHVDEPITIDAIEAIASSGLPTVGDGQLYWRALVAHYLMAIPLLFAETSIYTARLVTVIFSVLLLPVVFYAARSLQGRLAGWLTVAFLCASSFQNWHANFARFYMPFQFFFVTSVVLAGAFLVLGKRVGVLLLLAVLATIGCHQLSIELAPVLALGFLMGRRWELLRNWRFHGSLVLLGMAWAFVLLYTPEAAFRNHWTPDLNAFELENKWAFVERLDTYAPFALVLTIAGVPIAKGLQNRAWLFVSLSTLGMLLGLSLAAPSSAIRYITNLLPLVVLCACATVAFGMQRVAGWSRQHGVRILTVACVVLIIGSAWQANAARFEEAIGFESRVTDQEPAHAYLREHVSRGDVVISLDPLMTKWYLGKRTDYWLRQPFGKEKRMRRFPEGQRVFLGVPVLDSAKQLEKIVKNAKGTVWIYSNWNYRHSVRGALRRVIRRRFKTVWREDSMRVLRSKRRGSRK